MPEQRCGTCGHWTPAGNGSDYGDCGAPAPTTVGPVAFAWSETLRLASCREHPWSKGPDGRDCPVWRERKQGEART